MIDEYEELYRRTVVGRAVRSTGASVVNGVPAATHGSGLPTILRGANGHASLVTRGRTGHRTGNHVGTAPLAVADTEEPASATRA